MEQTLEYIQGITNSIAWVSIVFITFVFVFHFCLIIVFPLNNTKWKLVEYVWVILAFISTLGIVNESRHLNARIEASKYISKVKTDQLNVLNWFENYKIYTCEESLESNECPFFLRALNDLKLIINDPDGVAKIPLNLVTSLSDKSMIVSESSKLNIKQRIQSHNKTLNIYLNKLRESKQSYFERLIVALTPLLLACALALKFAKVTGEYLLYKEK